MGFQTMSERNPTMSVRDVVTALKLSDALKAAETLYEINPNDENETRLINAQLAYDMFNEKH